MMVRSPRRLLVLSALAAVWLAGFVCVPHVRAGEAGWVSVRTKSFLVVGRGREREVLREAARLEQLHALLSAAFARTVGGERGGPYAPTTVILFPDDKSYA